MKIFEWLNKKFCTHTKKQTTFYMEGGYARATTTCMKCGKSVPPDNMEFVQQALRKMTYNANEHKLFPDNGTGIIDYKKHSEIPMNFTTTKCCNAHRYYLVNENKIAVLRCHKCNQPCNE